MPSRADIDPVNIRGELLMLLFLLDVIRSYGGLGYLYRLVGTAMRTWSDVIRPENSSAKSWEPRNVGFSWIHLTGPSKK